MISLQLRSTFTIALISFVLGCLLSALFINGCNNGSSKKQVLIPVSRLKAQGDSLKASYDVKIKTLESANSQLEQHLEETKAALQAAKARAKTKAAGLKKIIEPKKMTAPHGYPARELLDKTIPAVASTDVSIDSIDNNDNSNNSMTPCDSLQQLAGEYVQATEIKDSLYEMQISQQDSIIKTQNEQLCVQKEHQQQTDTLLDQSLKAQESLVIENNHLHKVIKRKRRSGGILVFGAAILSGITTHYLSK